jgi:hypothetical protein
LSTNILGNACTGASSGPGSNCHVTENSGAVVLEGNTPAGFTSSSDLTANSVNTNVAVDMFFDSDPKAAQNSTQCQTFYQTTG